MTLSEWVAQHRDEIVAEDAARKATETLTGVIAREIADAESVPSDDGRFEHAVAACPPWRARRWQLAATVFAPSPTTTWLLNRCSTRYG
jgi:hypothetical protein